MTSLGRLPRSSAAPPPLEDDDLLSEILLCLPPQPSSLPRASVVCKRWHRLVTEPHFICRFRRLHRRNPPLLGFFNNDRGRISFQPTLDAPNRVPPGRFSLQLDDRDGFRLLSSRHGLVLFLRAHKRKEILVWDPVTGDQHSVAVPAEFYTNTTHIQGSVLRATGEVHHFEVVLVAAREDDKQHTRVLASVYSSEAGVWGNPPISTPLPPEAYTDDYFTTVCWPEVLVGDSLYWPLIGNFATSLSYILEFNLERHSLAIIEVPVDEDTGLTVMRAEGGGLGFLCLSDSELSAQLWKRMVDRDGAASWVLGRTIELDKLLSLNSKEEGQYLRIVGFAEYNNVVFMGTRTDPFMVDLESLQFKKLFQTTSLWHPFESVYVVPAISGQLIL